MNFDHFRVPTDPELLDLKVAQRLQAEKDPDQDRELQNMPRMCAWCGQYPDVCECDA